MNRIFSFVSPLLKGIVSPLLGVASSSINKINDGVKVVANVSDENPKKSGVAAVVMGWLGLDPASVDTIGTWLVKIGTWVQSF